MASSKNRTRAATPVVDSQAATAEPWQRVLAGLLLAAWVVSSVVITTRGSPDAPQAEQFAGFLGAVTGSLLSPLAIVAIAMLWKVNRTNARFVRILSIATLCLLFIRTAGAAAIAGVRGYVTQNKSVEGEAGVRALAEGIARCAAAPAPGGSLRGLPGSSGWHPARLAATPGEDYESTPSDWATESAFQCAGFERTGVQRFTYQWRRESLLGGVARASADLNGDNVVDVTIEQALECRDGAHCIVKEPVYR